MNKLHRILLPIVLLIFVLPTLLSAAPAQLSKTAKTKLDKAITTANSQLAMSINIQYDMLLRSQEYGKQWDEKIQALHKLNADSLIRVRKRINLIDEVNVNGLGQQVDQAKSKYKPLFESYTLLNKQIQAAKKLKNTSLNRLLGTQAEAMKISVQLARTDIRNKEERLKTAKTNRTKEVKSLRETLSRVDSMKKKLTEEKSRLRTSSQRFTSQWKSWNDTIKKAEPKNIFSGLVTLNTTSTQMNTYRQQMYGYEKSIQDVIWQVEQSIIASP